MSKAFLGGFEGSLVLVLSGFVCSDLVFCLFFSFFWFCLSHGLVFCVRGCVLLF